MTIYSSKTRRAAARTIMDANLCEGHEACVIAKRAALAHWNVFVPHALSPLHASENEVEYIEHRFAVLYRYAAQWVIEDLSARIEALESPNGSDQG
jgi:hypothetical protein